MGRSMAVDAGDVRQNIEPAHRGCGTIKSSIDLGSNADITAQELGRTRTAGAGLRGDTGAAFLIDIQGKDLGTGLDVGPQCSLPNAL